MDKFGEENLMQSNIFIEAQVAFDQFDLDMQKKLNYSQFKYAIRSLGFNIKKEEVQQLFDNLSENNFIYFNAFWTVIQDTIAERHDVFCDNRQRQRHMKQLKSLGSPKKKLGGDKFSKDLTMAFNSLDIQKKGYISAQDLKNIAKQLGDEVSDQLLTDMISELEGPTPGQINEKQFKQVMTEFMRKNALKL